MAAREAGSDGASEPPGDTGPAGAVRRLLAAVVACDPDAIADCYAYRDDLLVYVEGPRWQTLGHQAVAKGWRDFCAAGPALRRVDFTDGPHLFSGDHPHATVACLAGTVEMDVLRPTGEATRVPMRMTWVMVRDPDRWRIVHEHGSQPLPDPYGTGDWLRPETAA